MDIVYGGFLCFLCFLFSFLVGFISLRMQQTGTDKCHLVQGETLEFRSRKLKHKCLK